MNKWILKLTRKNWRTVRETCPIGTLFPTSPTWTVLIMRIRSSTVGVERQTLLEIKVLFETCFIVAWRRLYTILDKNTPKRMQLYSSRTLISVESLGCFTFWWQYLLFLREWPRIKNPLIRGSLKISSTVHPVVRPYKYFVLSLEMWQGSDWYIVLCYLKIPSSRLSSWSAQLFLITRRLQLTFHRKLQT